MHIRRNIRPGRPINRRDFLKLGGLAGAASVLAACGGTVAEATQIPPQVSPTPTPTQAAGRAVAEVALRIAHLSDMHVAAGGPSAQDFGRALQHAQARSPKIDIILNTGDCVGDSLGATKDAAQAQWDAFVGAVKAEASLPIYHAIGNHDVWGWGLPANVQKSLRGDPLFGKGFALQELGLPNRYYSFDKAGWRFLILDSTHLPPSEYPEYGQSYVGELDDDQYKWLVQQLEATPPSMPVCIASHIPIISACELLDGTTEYRGNWLVPGAWVHIDARRLWALFWQHRNVKLCLSGHTHQVEDVRYHGVKYLSDGSTEVAYMDFPPGYAIINLYKDGSSDSEFVTL
jgi:3',5'-cyclic AMP phosphodiesterase CpdA